MYQRAIGDHAGAAKTLPRAAGLGVKEAYGFAAMAYLSSDQPESADAISARGMEKAPEVYWSKVAFCIVRGAMILEGRRPDSGRRYARSVCEAVVADNRDDDLVAHIRSQLLPVL